MRYPEYPDSLQRLETSTLEVWREERLFERVQESTADGEPWVFWEGPPTANGRPGLHHIISRTIKDLFCRYHALQGRQVTRIAGWDTHGLPVELEAERKLGINGKPEIEAVGIEAFNEACRDSVFTYKEEWERLSERIGYWLDYSRPYVTFHTPYIESVWAVLKELAARDLLYRGHKSVPYCPRCGTALSSHEVAQGYREVDDPSLYFLVPVVDEDGADTGRYFVVWTTTPWTVPSNVGLAVHPDLTYAELRDSEGRTLIMEESRVECVLGEEAKVEKRRSGSELVGLRYRRPLELVPAPDDPRNAWTVVSEAFVSAEEGTGIVHLAPAFGADDHAAGLRHDLPMIRPLDDAAVFTDEVDRIGGLFVKDADPVVIDALDEAGLLLRAERALHNYPHCWRCNSPLIHLARASWFAATSTLKDEMLANNDTVAWHPAEVGEKRFGEWLRGNVDWALSRDRYWGTPIPVWVCDRDDTHLRWIGSLAELDEAVGGLPEGFDPHRPFIDALTWPCECVDGCEGTMRRTPGVVDVWFDSGAMPYAQWHYPFENPEAFERHYPADFICEGLDQTRGWFYSLMAIATMLGRDAPYRNVVVNDLLLDADGQKMSKSKGNTVDPWHAVEGHGADSIRWSMIVASNPWVPKRWDPEAIRENERKFFDTLANTYRFLTLYANTSGWTPSGADPAPAARHVLDRWVLSRLATLTAEVRDELDRYEPTRAYRAVAEFVDELSNWYVRRSRSRFWGSGESADARAAFRTLWEALRTIALLIAPVTPFVADWLHRALTGESAHLATFPIADEDDRDAALEAEMASARTLVSLGRAAREDVRIRVRQPLRRMKAVVPSGVRVSEIVLELVRDELNLKEVEFLGSAEGIVKLEPRPNYRSLGPRFGKATNDAAEAIRALGQSELAAFRVGTPVTISAGDVTETLCAEDVEIVEVASGDEAVRSESGHTVALDPSLDEELLREGMARELVNRIQRLRRDTDLEISDRIALGVFGPDPVLSAATAWESFVTGETLAVEVETARSGSGDDWLAFREVDLDGVTAQIGLRRIDR
ncbi:MAG: isoleucine--tRNA ligase [Longimicrobiales bacterium]|nr:isoleucine--tRNA ligase [Longimicrobiales bacterium]